ncbi:MAG: hypothetical protein IH612_05705, partial [Desulfofustis sp.]|nr:hypothetical protein [Desulfofustis sp.]
LQKALNTKNRLAMLACVAVLPAAILAYNFNYLVKQLGIVKPLSFLSGDIERDKYISNFRPEYPAISFLNDEHGETKTLAVFLGNRGYYFDDEVLFDLRGGKSLLCELTKNVEHDSQIADILVSKGFTHLIIRYDLFNHWIGQQLDNSEQQRLLRFLQQQATLLYANNGHGVFRISPISK